MDVSSRKEVRDFASSCENLLYSLHADPPLTRDETSLVGYYVEEVARAVPKAFAVLPERKEDVDYDLEQLSLSLLLG